RPGKTPLRYDLLLPTGAAGKLDVNGAHGIRVAPDLPSTLRSLPGVRQVKLSLARPWVQEPAGRTPVRPGDRHRRPRRKAGQAMRPSPAAAVGCANASR